MKYSTVRAMMIGMMEKESVDALHKMELSVKRGLMPDEVTYLFTNREIKGYYGIPDDDEAQAMHNIRIEKEILNNKLLRTLSGDWVHCLDLDGLHEYDWNVYNALDRLNLQYQGERKLAGRLKELVK
jgi:hypothetical protein